MVLSHFDGANNSKTFVDQKGHTFQYASNAHLTSDTFMFGGTSLWVSYSGEVLTMNYSEFVLGTGDFTLETWARPYQYRSTMMPIVSGLENTTLNGVGIGIDPSGYVMVFDHAGVIGTGNISVPVGTWAHIALTRSGNTLNLWVQGKLAGAFSYTKNLDSGYLMVGEAYTPYNSGTVQSGYNYFFGYIDDLRLTKGVARYSAPFSAPTAAFPNS